LLVRDTVGPRSVETKTDTSARVFISYSRKDMAFADRLEAALKAHGFEVLIDREEIYAFEDWWKRIQALIGQSDTVVFVLSVDAVKSEVALKEVAYAASLNKRFAPIVCRQVEDSAVPEALRRLNFIFFDDPERFEASVDRLADALRTDIGWVRQHTEYGEAERSWSAAGRPNSLLLRSPTLEVAEYWMGSRPAGAPEPSDEIRLFVATSRKAEVAARRRSRILNAALYTLLVGIILGLVGWIEQSYIADRWTWYVETRPYMQTHFRPYVLSATAERALKPKDTFRECAAPRLGEVVVDVCPEMIVVGAGSFVMGSPPTEKGRRSDEGPQHKVTIVRPFAVSKFEITFHEWFYCGINQGDCYHIPSVVYNEGLPVTNVSWLDAGNYVEWLSKMTGKKYRLLSEAEYEYAARGGMPTVYPWGDEVGKNNANCSGCGSQWEGQLAPVGSFAPNRFGLYDMVGNVWEWTDDCAHKNYDGAPDNGSLWIKDCGDGQIVRGGSWNDNPENIRSARRNHHDSFERSPTLGFRVARPLVTP
jgi:formylglycine-generating enzyme required for sulfatase activity